MNENKGNLDFFGKLLKSLLPIKHRKLLKKRFAEPAAMLCSNNLRFLAKIYDSDKWGKHWYCQHYERHFAPLRKKSLTLLEIGIGGYDDPKAGGASLRMWRKYFSRGLI